MKSGQETPAPWEGIRPDQPYRGRLAPSPTGYLHLGHARTFWTARERARSHHGITVLRNEDLDKARCQRRFVDAMFEDLRWFGFDWEEGPDRGGRFGPYNQSERLHLYREAFASLQAGGFVYPCFCSRQDIRQALSAPHQGDQEPVYPGTCRPAANPAPPVRTPTAGFHPSGRPPNWRFLVPEGEAVTFHDGRLGRKSFLAGLDFGDFILWRHDGIPSYQLAVMVDDAAMRITEVVRGEDLLVSTARQILLYRALQWTPPAFFHVPLMRDQKGRRLAKREAAFSLRRWREGGVAPESLRADWQDR
jgi:glutamyl-tRNA synthetase